jgi:membrane-associated protein
MGVITTVIDFILHLDAHLGQIISTYGMATYAILFTVIFVETGLVFFPFLPGDSLLFVAGAFAALGSLNIWILLVLLMVAAIAGDTANYWIGHFLGEKIIANKRIPINEKHLAKTHEFFAKHGGKTIIIARFVPVVRTFAPFVAGIGKMNYFRFITYNVIGAVSWVSVGIVAGYFFGNIPFIKNNFTFFILGIILLSIIPVLFPVIWGKMKKRQSR